MTQPLTVTLDPAAGAPFAAGTQTLLPGQELAVRKHLQHDVMLFIHKGQARAAIGEQSMAVVPGAMLYAPRGTWCGLRNTGTGALQVAWAGSPGIEAVFRDVAGLGPSPSPEALQEIAQRHQIEFRPSGAAPAPARAVAGGRRRRGRRGGRPHAQSASASALPPATGPAAPAALAAAPPRPPRQGPRHPDRGPRRRRGARPPSSAKSPHAGARSGRAPRYPRKVKEVYMGGQWIKVEGAGPVIAPRRRRPDPNRNRDDDTPPLSFAL